MDLSLQNERKAFSISDATDSLGIVCNGEILLEKKRRWLQLPPYIRSGKRLVRRKIPKFLTEEFIPESYVRKDEVSCDIVRSAVEECFRCFDNYESQNHVVAHMLDLFNSNAVESTERILSIIGDLTNATLYSVACIITGNKLKFKGTRPELVGLIKDHLQNFLLDASEKSDELRQMSKLFKNPNSYLQKNQKIITPVTDHLLISISKILERLDELTIRELLAMYGRLNGIKEKPHFPPVLKNHCSTKTILSEVKKLCDKFFLSLQVGQEMPEEFANGLTVAVLSIYVRLDHPNIPISEFCHFPEHVMSTQMAILDALRSLHKLRKEEIDQLISLVDPNGSVPRLSFKNTLKKFMMEYLFVCDQISVPNEVLRAVNLINKRQQGEPILFSKKNRDKEVEAVLNVSCYLKSVATSALLEDVCENSADAEDGGDGYDEELNKWCPDNNDFKFCGTDYMFSTVTEGIGGDMETAFSNFLSESVNFAQGSTCKKPSEKHKGWSQADSGSQIKVNEICDETALVAHELIGHVIDGFLKLENRDADRSALSYLTDGVPNGDGKVQSNEETNILLEAVEKILPSLPKSSLTKVKSLLGP